MGTMPNKITITELPHHSLVHSFNRHFRLKNKKPVLFGILIIVAGIISGYQLTRATSSGTSQLVSETPQAGSTKAKVVVGSEDTQTFSDSAEGTIEKGGINGEGTHKLIRPGGESQTVYLTSSVLDLSQFEGKKVRVWGQTFSAKKAGWLMDVGKIEVL